MYRRAYGSSRSTWSKGRQPSGVAMHSSHVVVVVVVVIIIIITIITIIDLIKDGLSQV